MMHSFGRQEGGGFRRREGKLVSPVRRDYPPHLQTDRREKEGEETGRKRERNPPLKSPPGKERSKRKTKWYEGREEGRGEKKELREKNNKKLLTNERKKIL